MGQDVMNAGGMVRGEEQMASRERNAEIGLPPARELGKHPGEWVAIVNRRIVASGKDALKVLLKARMAAPDKEPSMFRVPTGEILLV